MNITTTPFTDEQRRMLVDAFHHCEQWLFQIRLAKRYSGWMTWKRKNGVDYLTRGESMGANQRSIGRRSVQTEAQYSEFVQKKAAAKEGLATIKNRLAERGRMMKSIRMARVPLTQAQVIREFDVQGLMDSYLVTVGDHALAAYESMAGRWFPQELFANECIEFACRPGSIDKARLLRALQSKSLLKCLKTVDLSLTVDGGKLSSVQIAKGLGGDVFRDAVPDQATPTDSAEPLARESQQWLFSGKMATAVAIDTKGAPLRIVAPDPRLYACYKVWISKDPKRPRIKQQLDLHQASAVAVLVQNYLPMFPFDDEFITGLKPQFRECFDRYLSGTLVELRDDDSNLRM